MKVTLKVGGHFDSAHKLNYYEGKCKQLHGHRFTYQVGIKHKVNTITGIALDFKKVKETLRECIEDRYDHQYLNDVLEDEPTAENLAIDIFKNLQGYCLGDYVTYVEVFESPECSALITREDFEEGLDEDC